MSEGLDVCLCMYSLAKREKSPQWCKCLIWDTQILVPLLKPINIFQGYSAYLLPYKVIYSVCVKIQYSNMLLVLYEGLVVLHIVFVRSLLPTMHCTRHMYSIKKYIMLGIFNTFWSSQINEMKRFVPHHIGNLVETLKGTGWMSGEEVCTYLLIQFLALTANVTQTGHRIQV